MIDEGCQYNFFYIYVFRVFYIEHVTLLLYIYDDDDGDELKGFDINETPANTKNCAGKQHK